MDKNGDVLEAIERLKKEIADLKYEQGKDRQRIAELELYINSKNEGRRDFDHLSVKLRKEVFDRKSGMDYKDVLNFFHFKSHEEAFRLMKKTAKKFPGELKLHKPNGGKRGRLRIVIKAM